MDLVVCSPRINAMAPHAVDAVRRLTEASLRFAQLPFVTQHVIHGGMYVRTVTVPPTAIVTGVFVKVPTVLILSGEGVVFTGEAEPLHVRGYNVVPAAAGRKQAFVAISELTLTMMFPTDAKTVEDAERHFTDEIELLCPLTERDRHVIIVTGE